MIFEPVTFFIAALLLCATKLACRVGRQGQIGIRRHPPVWPTNSPRAYS